MTVISPLTRVKTRLGLTDTTRDALLAELLTSAEDAAKAYTGRDELPSGAQTAVVCLAVIAYNRRGTEGETSRSEGGISVSMEAIPGDIRAMLAPYRIIRTVM